MIAAAHDSPESREKSPQSPQRLGPPESPQHPWLPDPMHSGNGLAAVRPRPPSPARDIQT